MECEYSKVKQYIEINIKEAQELERVAEVYGFKGDSIPRYYLSGRFSLLYVSLLNK